MSEQTDPSGKVRIELRVEVELPLSIAVRGWTNDEIAGLLAGDEEALDALKQEMTDEALRSPSDVEIEDFYLRAARPSGRPLDGHNPSPAGADAKSSSPEADC